MSETHLRRKWPFVAGGIVVLAVIAVLMFQWDWLIPLVDRKASAALGRRISITHLHVRPGWVPHIEAEGIHIANPQDWPGGGDMASIDKFAFDVDAMAYIRKRQLILRLIEVDHPVAELHQLEDGTNNYTFSLRATPAQPVSVEPEIKLGQLQINDGHVNTVLAKLGADFRVGIVTKDNKVEAEAKGIYDKQPITASFVGGALLSLQDAEHPYAVQAKLTNGLTHLALDGTVENPLSFAGANLKLELAGPDMALLLPLIGVAIPRTPPYDVAGQLDYEKGVVMFTKARGRFGSTDLEGGIEVDTKPEARPVVTATLHSQRVDLKDLGGFIGAEPGDAAKGTKNATAPSTGKVLPSDPISLPRLSMADVHLRYTATRIEGRSQPLDNMRANLDIVNGEVKLHPLAFGIGGGQISAAIDLAEKGKALRAQATIDFQRVSMDKLLAATGAARGAGSIGGQAVIAGTGRSLADILGHGDGELKLYMGSGGNVSALTVDLSGLQFGNAVLSALGIPNRAKIQCLLTDFVLHQGQLAAKTAVLDTDENRVSMTGSINLQTESLNLVLRTEPKHFSIGSLPAPVDITGTLGAPSVRPDVAVLAARAGAAIGLGILLTPLGALLPTIQLGTGEDGACAGLLQQAKTPPRVIPARRR